MHSSADMLSTGFLLEWSEAPWDSVLFGFPVLQITRIQVCQDHEMEAWQSFELKRDKLGCRFVSCRLDATSIIESIFLEDRGFRHIEVSYQPVLEIDTQHDIIDEVELAVRKSTADSLAPLLKIAGTAFRNERFHVDPRLDPSLGDQRYRNWVANSLSHSRQSLYELWDGLKLVAFFVLEFFEDGTCYWHLNAVNPDFQGVGYGERAWRAMISFARTRGARRVRSNIVARNIKVLNLYSKLGFKFLPPQMALHWVATGG